MPIPQDWIIFLWRSLTILSEQNSLSHRVRMNSVRLGDEWIELTLHTFTHFGFSQPI
jgi:hypothetical protein